MEKKKLLKPYVPIKALSALDINKTSPSTLNNTQNNPSVLSFTAEPLQIFPTEVIFRDIQIYQTYEIGMTIRNLTTAARKIRLFTTMSDNFIVKYDEKANSIASGLAMRVTIIFDAKQAYSQVFKSEIRISSQGFEKKVPLKAYGPESILSFPEKINFGYVKVDKSVKKSFQITNNSKKKVDVRFTVSEDLNLKVNPCYLELKEGQKNDVEVEYTAENLGNMKGKLDVIYSSLRENARKHIDLNAVTVDSCCFLVDAHGQHITLINFNNMYLGESMSEKFLIINNSPKVLNFRINIIKGTTKEKKNNTNNNSNNNGQNEESNIISPRTLAKEQVERIIHCEPEQSTIEPYSEFPFLVTAFKKPSPKQIKQVEDRIMNRAPKDQTDAFIVLKNIVKIELQSIDGPEDEITVNSTCTTILPKIQLSQSVFDFGEVPLKDKKSILFEVKNLESRALKFSVQSTNNTNTFYPVKGPNFKVEPKSRKQIELIFHPKIPGVYNQLIKFKILETYEYELKVLGTCKKTIMLPLTHSISMQNTMTSVNQTLRVKSPTEAPASSQEHKQMLTMTGTLWNYNKERREKRELQKSRSLLRTKLIDKLNMQPNQEGMPLDPDFEVGLLSAPNETAVRIPFYNEQLYMNTSYKNNEDFVFPTIMPAKPWPCAPKNNREARDILHELTLQELKSIIVNTSNLDFGTVFIKSVCKKVFCLKNCTSRYIMVELRVFCPELQKTNCPKQIVPPNEVACFEIVLESRTSGEFKNTIKYILNGFHQFEFMAVANLIPITLEPNNKIIRTQFTDLNLGFDCYERFKLLNHGNAVTRFKFAPSTPDKTFTVEPSEGEVQPQSFIELTLAYTPKCLMNENSIQRTDQERLYYKVIGGADNFIKCIGTVYEAKCSIKQTQFNFGQISVCKSIQGKLTVKNHSRCATVFKLELEPKELVGIVKFDCAAYRLGSEEKREVGFTFLSKVEKFYKGEIVVIVRASKKFRIPIQAKCTLPKLHIVEDQINLGRVTTLGNPCQTFRIRNDSPFEGIVEIDSLCEHPERIEIVAPIAFKEYLSIQNKTRGGEESECSSQQSSESELSISPLHPESNEPAPSSYTIRVPANFTMQLQLKMSPKIVGSFRFFLPIKFKGYDGLIEGLTRQVIYEAVEPSLIIEPQIIDFKKKIIQEKQQFKCMLVEIVNPSDKTVSWRAGFKEQQYNSIFVLDPCEGTIQEKTKTTMLVQFSPTNPGNYECVCQIFIDGANYPYTEIKMIGSGILPALVFDRKELIFPVVPIGIESKISFKIENYGYESITLSKWKVEENWDGVDVVLDFRQGHSLSVTKRKISIDATFRSMVPISLTSTFIFWDENGIKFTLPFSATCDNCLLSIYPYLEINEGEYCINFDEKEYPQLNECDNAQSETELIRSRRRLGTGLNFNKREINHSQTDSVQASLGGIKIQPLNIVRKSTNYILRWLQYFVTDKITSFPGGVIEKNGEPMFLMYTSLTNKTFKTITDILLDRTQRIKQLLIHYHDFIRVLKSQGCYLNHIRPEYLLSEADYCYYCNYIINKPIANIGSVFSSQYEAVNSEFWSIIFYQMCRVYLLPKITPKTLRSLYSSLDLTLHKNTSSSTSSNNALVTLSNIYGVSEYSLLTFVNNILGERKVATFDDPSFKGEFFAFMLDKVLGTDLADKVRPIRKQSRMEDITFNTQIILSTLHEFGLAFHLDPVDLSFPSSKQIVLYLVHLISVLPFYFPKQTLKFVCELREECVKTIELNNPSNKEISYWVKIIGTEGFKLESMQVTIPPKQTAEFKVSFLCRFFKNVSSRLYFIQKQDEQNKLRAAPLVFTLQSQVTGKSISKIVTFEAHLYEMSTFYIDVESPFDNNEYPMELSVAIAEDERAKTSSSNASIHGGKKMQVFFLNNSKIKLYKSKESKLELRFLALTLQNRSCRLSFFEPSRGEFLYEIQVSILKPLPLRRLKLKECFVNKEEMTQLEIPIMNESLVRARKSWIEMTKTKPKTTIFGTKFFCEIIPNEENIQVQKEVILDKFKIDEEGVSNENIMLPLKFEFKKSYKDYSFFLIMSNSALSDIRVFKISLRVQPQPVRMKLQMEVHAKEEVLQWFPIKTFPSRVALVSDSPYLKLLPDGIKEFTQPSANCKVGLHFRPLWLCKEKASFCIEDAQTMEKIVYEINAVGLEPKPDSTISLRMQNHTKQIKVAEYRPSSLGTLNVIPQVNMKFCSIVVAQKQNPVATHRMTPANFPKTVCYEVQFQPKQIGNYTGNIKFVEPKSGQYSICAINLEVVDSEKKGEVFVSCRAGTSKYFMISEGLELDTPYSIKILAPCVTRKSMQNKISQAGAGFEFCYQPLVESKETSGRIIFTNQNTGYEDWFEVKMLAEPVPFVKVPYVACQLKSELIVPLELVNPLSVPLTYQISNTDAKRFLTEPQICLAVQKEPQILNVIYKPNSLNEINKSIIRLTSPQLYTQQFHLVGQALPPVVNRQVNFVADAQNVCEQKIKITNPLFEETTLKLFFAPESPDTEADAFTIVNSPKPNVFSTRLMPNETKDIVLSFQPKSIKLYKSKLIVEIHDIIKWTYNLRGEFMLKLNCQPHLLSTTCRSTIAKIVELKDPSLMVFGKVQFDKQFSKVAYPKILCSKNGYSEIQISFSPYKPLSKLQTSMTLDNGEGSKWLVPLILEAKAPEPDDTMSIECTLNSTTAVSFRLTNRHKNSTNFIAYMHEESDIQIDIEPKKGVLEGYGKSGSVFNVSFSPNQGHKKYQGLVIIETEDMYWSFKVFGRTPKYVPPSNPKKK